MIISIGIAFLFRYLDTWYCVIYYRHLSCCMEYAWQRSLVSNSQESAVFIKMAPAENYSSNV